MLLVSLIVLILLSTSVLMYQWCQFRVNERWTHSRQYSINSTGLTDSPTFYDFAAGRTTCQIWAFTFTRPSTWSDFVLGSSTNIDALRSEWREKEIFRFILVAYVNIFILVLLYTYVCVKNLNEFMEEKRRKQMKKAPRKTVVGVNKEPSYFKLRSPDQ